jgi:hypothetical protein
MRSLKGVVAGVVLILVAVVVLSPLRTEHRSAGPIHHSPDAISGRDHRNIQRLLEPGRYDEARFALVSAVQIGPEPPTASELCRREFGHGLPAYECTLAVLWRSSLDRRNAALVRVDHNAN